MKKHGVSKWESRLFSFSASKGISWDGKKKRKIILSSEITKVGDTDAAPNQMLKKCGFTIELRSGKIYTLCAASARQKLEVASRIEDMKDFATLQAQTDKERINAESVLAKQALIEKERIAKEKRELAEQKEREAQEAVLARQAAFEKEKWEAKKREELELREARRRAEEEETARLLAAEEERKRAEKARVLAAEEERKRQAAEKAQLVRSSGQGIASRSSGAPTPPPRSSGAVVPSPTPPRSSVPSMASSSSLASSSSSRSATSSPQPPRALPRAVVGVSYVDNRATVLLDSKVVAARTSSAASSVQARDLDNRATVMLKSSPRGLDDEAPRMEAPAPPVTRSSGATFQGFVAVKIPKNSSFGVSKKLQPSMAQARNDCGCEVSLQDDSVRIVAKSEEKLRKATEILNDALEKLGIEFENWSKYGDSVLEAYEKIEADDISAMMEDELVELIQAREDF